MILPRWLPWAMCIVIAFVMTGPVWIADTPSLVGNWDALDLAGSVWAHWWTADAIGRGANPFDGTASFFPFGFDPLLQYNLLDATLNAPWSWLAGPRVGYNLATIAALTTTGMGGYALARSTGSQQAGALLTAVIIETSSALTLELYAGRLSQVMLVFLLLSLAALIRMLRQPPTIPAAIGLGLAAAATALVYWYFGFALLLAAAAILAGHRHLVTRRHTILLALSAFIGLSLTLPFVLDLLQQWDGLPGVHRGGPESAALALDTGREIALKNSRWALWPLVNNSDLHGHQIGAVTIGLTIIAIRWKLKGIGSWLCVALTGWVLALGPILQGYSNPTSIPMPYAWLQSHIPTFDRMWWPHRFEILTVIGLAVVAGHGLDRLMRSRQRAGLWLMAAILLSVIDAPLRSGLIPVIASPTPDTNSALYEGLEGPLLTTPVSPSGEVSNLLLWTQTVHGQPTQNGDGEHIPGHRPDGYTEWLEGNPLLQALTRLQRAGKVTVTIDPQAVAELREDGFRYVVVDHTVYPDGRGHNWAAAHGSFFKQLWGPPLRSVDGGAVWALDTIDAPREIKAAVGSGRSRRLR